MFDEILIDDSDGYSIEVYVQFEVNVVIVIDVLWWIGLKLQRRILIRVLNKKFWKSGKSKYYFLF